MVSLGEAISAYQAALENLLPQKADDSTSKVMRALLARDHVAHLLSGNQSTTPEALLRITELDQRLKTAATKIDVIVERSTLASWRETVQPPASAWWWFLDERAAAAEPKSHPLWAILTWLFIISSIFVVIEILRRFLSRGEDYIGFLSVISTILQAVPILLVGGALTQLGRETVKRLLSSRGIMARDQPKWETAIVFIMFIVVASVLLLLLPAMARAYNDQGVRLQQIGRVTSAINSYQHAVSLDPDYAQAHYNLATAFEDVLEYDKALAEYQTALRADPQLYLAYNNLARLYMLRRSDFASALTALNAALELKLNLDQPQQSLVQYSLFKNRGWANFGLKYFGLAEADLRQALALRADGAAAHCLLAQVLEAQGNPKVALAEWEACLRYEKGDVVEANWLGLARERLSQGGSK